MKEEPFAVDAEILSEPKAPEQFYGTSIPQKTKHSHIGLIVFLSLTVILVSVAHMLVLLLGIRIVRSGDGWKLTVGADASGQSADAPRALRDADPKTLANGPVSGDGPTVRLVPADGAELSAAQCYAKVCDTVVSLRAEFFDGTQSFTGVIVSSGGYVLSSCNDLSEAFSVECGLSDGTEAAISWLGTDERTGLTLLKLEGEALPVAAFGTASEARPGDAVISIGNPSDGYLRNVLCEGVLTAVGSDPGSGLRLLRSSAVFESGGCGSPLVDAHGLVIGLTSTLGQASADGTVFAVPADELQAAIDRILAENPAAEQWLGFDVGQIPYYVSAYYGFPGTLWIRDIADAALQSSGLCSYDVLVRVDGEQVGSLEDFQRLLSEHKTGEGIELIIYRGGSYYRIELPILGR